LLAEPLEYDGFIGIIMLAGIAVNNSILLVDAANRLKAEGFALTEAIKGAAQQRIRPIIIDQSDYYPGFIADVFRIRRGCFTAIPYGFGGDRRSVHFYPDDISSDPVCLLHF